MKFLGFDIQAPDEITLPFGIKLSKRQQNLSSIWQNTGWTSLFGPVQESYTGAWQANVLDSTTRPTLLSFSAVYCCVTGIASDIAKLRLKLTRNDNGIWNEVESNSPFLPVLRNPNHYQSRIQFIEQWILSKLLFGNTYVLLERDGRGMISKMYVLDPGKVLPLESETTGEVFYQLGRDPLAGVQDNGEPLIVPASEIIHDRMPALWHPLIGVSPLYACLNAAYLGGKIQADSSTFFANRAMPGGMLTAPGRISDDTATRLKETFETNFGGTNIGRLFVAGDGLKFEAFKHTAQQAEVVDQLRMSVEDVARAFHYPLFKMGGPYPPYGNLQSATISYYQDCLQRKIEDVEELTDNAMNLKPQGMQTEFDIDNLLRMDTASLWEANNKAVGGGWMAPDEARFRANLGKVDGGNTPYLQQQNYSLAALAKRDAQADPFASNGAAPPPEPQRANSAKGVRQFLGLTA